MFSVLPLPPSWLAKPQHEDGSNADCVEFDPIGTVCVWLLLWFASFVEEPPPLMF